MEKESVILDTDMANEIDDLFALCYLVKSLKTLKLEAITIAPFITKYRPELDTVEKGQALSLRMTNDALELLGANKYKKKVFLGAKKYSFDSDELSPASEEIIKVARENPHTTILAIGAPTNIAIALKHAPEIAEKIKIVWLGGNNFLWPHNDELNFRQDLPAVRTIFDSKAELVVIPTKNVAEVLKTTRFELRHYLSDSAIGKHLCNEFEVFLDNRAEKKIDHIGDSKTLWDISTVAYIVNPKWFKTKEYSAPKILDDTSYKMTKSKRKITFVYGIHRNAVYQDFFIKMGYKNV